MTEYLLLIAGLAILLLGGKFLVDGASGIAVKLGMSAGLIGLTIVAFGTSAPELLVSINAALKGNSDISIGNVVGSNIANLGLVLGLSGLFYPTKITKRHIRFEYLITLIVTGVFYLVSVNGMVDRWEGIAMFIAFVSFNIYLFWLEKKGVVKESKEVEEEIEQVKNFPWWKATLFFFGGIVGLYFGSDLLVENAVLISRNFGVSERVIGVTIIAIGTSLPELITSIMAALAKETDMALGNILGSNIMNILSIIGITAIIEPISVADEFIRVDFWWMIGITVLLFPLIKTKMQISKFEGSILFLTYLAYMFFLL